MITNRANAICILEILKEYSDKEHILPMRDIISKMKNIYGIDIDRRTVYSAVDLLKSVGYDISDFNDNGVGYFLLDRHFEVSEIRLLMDSVYSNRSISAVQTEKLIEKLQRLLSVHQRKIYRNLKIVKTDKKAINQELFLNIEVLDEAILKKKKVEFTYLIYNFDKSLKPRREEKYIINPYQMISTNEHYYLVGKLTPSSQIMLYRLDMIKDIALTNYEIDAQISENELDIVKNKIIYAWFGSEETITMRCKNIILKDVIDKFGKNAVIEKENDLTFTAAIKAVPEGVLFWALQYLPYVEVISPQSLREKIIDSIKSNSYIKME